MSNNTEGSTWRGSGWIGVLIGVLRQMLKTTNNWHRQIKEAYTHDIDPIEWTDPRYHHQN